MTMSVLPCATTFLLILLANLEEAYSARRPGVFDATGAMEQDENPNSDHSNLIHKKDSLKTDEQRLSSRQAVSSTAGKSSHNNDHNSYKREEVNVKAKRYRRHKHTSRKKSSHQSGGTTKATYKVPQEKNQEVDQQHIITLDDYSPPKLHPPTHN